MKTRYERELVFPVGGDALGVENIASKAHKHTRKHRTPIIKIQLRYALGNWEYKNSISIQFSQVNKKKNVYSIIEWHGGYVKKKGRERVLSYNSYVLDSSSHFDCFSTSSSHLLCKYFIPLSLPSEIESKDKNSY